MRRRLTFAFGFDGSHRRASDWTADFRVVYGFTESDEISLLFATGENVWQKVRKYNSTLAAEASASFSLALGTAATFDCRMVPLPTLERVRIISCGGRRMRKKFPECALLLDAQKEERPFRAEATKALEGQSLVLRMNCFSQEVLIMMRSRRGRSAESGSGRSSMKRKA